MNAYINYTSREIIHTHPDGAGEMRSFKDFFLRRRPIVLSAKEVNDQLTYWEDFNKNFERIPSWVCLSHSGLRARIELMLRTTIRDR